MTTITGNISDLNVLVVDDSFDVLNILKNMLRNIGVNQIFTARDGKAALDFLGETDDADMVNLILCDLVMPRMTGVELLKQVRSVHPDIPFLIITGHAEIRHVQDAKTHGANAFLKKPVSMQELKKKLLAVARVVGHRR